MAADASDDNGDARLRLAVADGDQRALVEVVREIVPKVLLALRRRYRNAAAESLEDAMSVALYRLWSGREHLATSKGSLGAWLYTVACHELVDRYRAESREPRAVDPLTLERFVATADVSADPSDVESEQLRSLRAAMDHLSVMDRRILIEGTQNPHDWTAAIANESGLTPNALRVRRHRLLVRLRNIQQVSADHDGKEVR